MQKIIENLVNGQYQLKGNLNQQENQAQLWHAIERSHAIVLLVAIALTLFVFM